MLSDEPIINDKVGNVDLVTDVSFTEDGFITREITKRELCDFLLSKVTFNYNFKRLQLLIKLLIGSDVTLTEMPYVALFTVEADDRNVIPPHTRARSFQPFMLATSMSEEFKGSENPKRRDFGPEEMMRSMFDVNLIRSILVDTTLGQELRYYCQMT